MSEQPLDYESRANLPDPLIAKKSLLRCARYNCIATALIPAGNFYILWSVPVGTGLRPVPLWFYTAIICVPLLVYSVSLSVASIISFARHRAVCVLAMLIACMGLVPTATTIIVWIWIFKVHNLEFES